MYQISFLPLFFDRDDLMGLMLSSTTGLLAPNNHQLQIINVYNRNRTTSHGHYVHPSLIFTSTSVHTLIAGDFNVHHSSTDPKRILSSSERTESERYLTAAQLSDFITINTPGSYTRHPYDSHSRPSAIDLTFVNNSLVPFLTSWDNDLPPSGSDHTVIRTSLSPLPTNASSPSPNWLLSNWETILPLIQNITIPPPSNNDIETWFNHNLAQITNPLLLHTPKKRPSSWSKKWWNEEISELRRIFHSVSRTHRTKFKNQRPPPSPEVKTAKAAYFKAISRAKKAHWDHFLSSASPADVWAAKRLKTNQNISQLPALPNASTPQQINSSLLNHFFPPKLHPPSPSLLPFSEHVPVSSDEISQALSKSSNSSTPGPDTIPYSVWKKVHRHAPSLLPALFSPLLQFGYHPLSLKKANGIVLPKPHKPNYTSPSSFRVIVLLETISKILERIVANRLASIARHLSLIHQGQCGSLKRISAAVAATALIHDIRTLQAAGFKVSTLFLDIKGGFDNVNPSILRSRLLNHGVPPYMVSWIISFLSQRECRLLFQGSAHDFHPVSVGVPQGSPISPLLFIIYVAPLHISSPSSITLSYVDDFAITVFSKSVRTNTRLLQKASDDISSVGTAIEVSFSIPKTELMHWTTARNRLPPTPNCSIRIQNTLFSAQLLIRWLGFWFTSNLNSDPHFARRLDSANKAFFAIKSLAPPGTGLTPANCRRLAQGLLLPILSYGMAIFTPSSNTLNKINPFWNTVLRWVTNTFNSTNTAALTREACLPPLQPFSNYLRRRHTLRLMSLSSTSNPATARFPPTFPTYPPSKPLLRSHLHGLGPKRPRPWNSNALTRVRPLFIDQLCFDVSPFLTPEMHPFFAGYPTGKPNLTIEIAASKASIHVKQALLDEWDLLLPPPNYYPFPTSLKPHLFMKLPRFIAGRIHQMRSHKSYLRAHPDWAHHLPPLCRRCKSADEDFIHAILECPQRQDERQTHLTNIESVSPDAPLWHDMALIQQLAEYIKATHTNYPPSWNNWADFVSTSRPSDVLSDVLSSSG